MLVRVGQVRVRRLEGRVGGEGVEDMKLIIGSMNRIVCVCRCYCGRRSGEDDAGAKRNG